MINSSSSQKFSCVAGPDVDWVVVVPVVRDVGCDALVVASVVAAGAGPANENELLPPKVGTAVVVAAAVGALPNSVEPVPIFGCPKESSVPVAWAGADVEILRPVEAGAVVEMALPNNGGAVVVPTGVDAPNEKPEDGGLFAAPIANADALPSVGKAAADGVLLVKENAGAVVAAVGCVEAVPKPPNGLATAAFPSPAPIPPNENAGGAELENSSQNFAYKLN